MTFRRENHDVITPAIDSFCASGLWVAMYDPSEPDVAGWTANKIDALNPTIFDCSEQQIDGADFEIVFRKAPAWTGLFHLNRVLVFRRTPTGTVFCGLREPIAYVYDHIEDIGAITFGPCSTAEKCKIIDEVSLVALADQWIESGYWRANRRPMPIEQFASVWREGRLVSRLHRWWHCGAPSENCNLHSKPKRRKHMTIGSKRLLQKPKKFRKSVARIIPELMKMPPSGIVEASGGRPARSYFLNCDNTLLPMKAVGRLAYIDLGWEWDGPQSIDMARVLRERFEVSHRL